jgi:hypothetical protein
MASKTIKYVSDNPELSAGTRVAHMDCNADLNTAAQCALLWDSMGGVVNPSYTVYEPIMTDYVRTRSERKALEGNTEHPNGIDMDDKKLAAAMNGACRQAWGRLLTKVGRFMEDTTFCKGDNIPTSGATNDESEKAMENKRIRDAKKSDATLKREAKVEKLGDARDARTKGVRADRDGIAEKIGEITKLAVTISSDIHKLEVNRAHGRDPMTGTKQGDTESLKRNKADLAKLNKILTDAAALIDKSITNSGIIFPQG